MLGFPFLFTRVFRFASACHKFSLCHKFRRATAFADLSHCKADTRSKRERRELFSEWTPFIILSDHCSGLGAEPKDLTFIQISLRGIIVFIATLAMVRLGHKRSLARKTAFDAVLIVILGISAVARDKRQLRIFCHLGRGRSDRRRAPALRFYRLLLTLVRSVDQRQRRN